MPAWESALMAELDRVRRWADALIALHLDPAVWSFGFDNAKTRAGSLQLHREAHHGLPLSGGAVRGRRDPPDPPARGRARARGLARRARAALAGDRARPRLRGQAPARRRHRRRPGALGRDLPERPHALPIPQAGPRARLRGVPPPLRRGQPHLVAAPGGVAGAAPDGRGGRHRRHDRRGAVLRADAAGRLAAARREPRIQPVADRGPLLAQDRVHGGVAPGAVGATLGVPQHALELRAQPQDRGARALVEHVRLELHALEAVVEGGAEQQALGLGVDARAPDLRCVGGPADVGRARWPGRSRRACVVPTSRSPSRRTTAVTLPRSQAR